MNVNSPKPTCEECGEPLGYSQYARALRFDGSAVNTEDNLACRNFPHCKKAQAESYDGCSCDESQCAKCLSVNCKNKNCTIHTKEAKMAWRQQWELLNDRKFPQPENF